MFDPAALLLLSGAVESPDVAWVCRRKPAANSRSNRERAGLFLLMSFKGQEEDNRHQLSRITKGEIFTEIYHCLLLGGLAFLVCVPPPRVEVSVAA